MSTSIGRVPSPRRKRAYHHGDLRQALVAATFELLRREGAAGVTLRGAARLAGVSQTAPYRHFADREALLAAAGAEAFAGLARAMGDARAGGPSPLDRLHAMGVAYVGFAAEDAARFRLMFGPELAQRARFPELDAASGRCFELLREALTECQRARAVRAGPVEPLTLLVWSSVHGLAALAVEERLGNAGRGREELEKLTLQLCRDLQRGLARTASSA